MTGSRFAQIAEEIGALFAMPASAVAADIALLIAAEVAYEEYIAKCAALDVDRDVADAVLAGVARVAYVIAQPVDVYVEAWAAVLDLLNRQERA